MTRNKFAQKCKIFCSVIIWSAFCILPEGCGSGEKIQMSEDCNDSYGQLASESVPVNGTGDAQSEESYQDSVYKQIDQTDLSDYLKQYGMQDCIPVHFTGKEGELCLDLYVDEKTGQGFGLKYGETQADTMLVFEMDGYQNDGIRRLDNFPNPYSVDITESDAITEQHSIPDYLKQEYDYYDESYEYRLGSRLYSYTLKGFIENKDGSVKQDEIYKILFSYREQGTLWKKEYWYNEQLFSTNVIRSQYSIYDELERLQYAVLGFEDQPAEEYYFCYEGESMAPFSCLLLSWCFLYMEHIEMQDYAQTYFPKDGFNAFLKQAGLKKEDIFYQYQWHNEDTNGIIWMHSDICLTLYFDKEKGTGCGYLEYPNESVVMNGFVFSGCTKVDCSNTDPYSVYATYDEENVYIEKWSLEEIARGKVGFYCDYDNSGRILRTLVTGNSDIERFYIYDGDNEMPSYCFNMVYGSRCGATLFEFNEPVVLLQ